MHVLYLVKEGAYFASKGTVTPYVAHQVEFVPDFSSHSKFVQMVRAHHHS